MDISYEMSRVIMVGDSVPVHEKTDSNSPVVGLLSNEIVQFDQQVWEQWPIDERVMQMQLLNGWVPVLLSNGRAGFVQNRYAYRPLDARVVFGKVNRQ